MRTILFLTILLTSLSLGQEFWVLNSTVAKPKYTIDEKVYVPTYNRPDRNAPRNVIGWVKRIEMDTITNCTQYWIECSGLKGGGGTFYNGWYFESEVTPFIQKKDSLSKWRQKETIPMYSKVTYPKELTYYSFKSDTTYYDWIIYRIDGVMHADSGFCVKSGWGSEHIAGFFDKYELEWWVWQQPFSLINYHFDPVKINLKDIWRTERKR